MDSFWKVLRLVTGNFEEKYRLLLGSVDVLPFSEN